MPKIIFESNEKHLIPEHLVSSAQEVDGKWELDAQGVLSKNRELLSDNSTLKSENDRLKTKEVEVTTLTGELANKNAEISRLSADLTKAQSNTLPTGYVAVSKKEADTLKSIKDKNLEIDKISEIVANFETVQKENADFKLDKSIAEFAEAEKVSNVKALTRLIKQDGVTPVIKEVEENGQKVKKGFLVKQNADKTEETPYNDYKKSNWTEFLPALEQQSRQIGNTGDPAPFSVPTDVEADKLAKQSQAYSTINSF